MRWFFATSYADAKGEIRPAFDMTKDGFTLLVMGYTGAKAMQFKRVCWWSSCRTTPSASEALTIADTPVPAAVGQDGKTYFSPKAICEGLGIDWKTQHVKVMADAVLSSCVVEITMQVPRSDTGNMTSRNVIMLPKEMAPEVQAKG